MTEHPQMTITRLSAELAEVRGERDRQYDQNVEQIARMASIEAERDQWRKSYHDTHELFMQADTRADKAETWRDALIGAAYETAARLCWAEVTRLGHQLSGPPHGEIQTARWQAGKLEADMLATKIEALTPASATAAYTDAIRAAHVAGMREAADITALMTGSGKHKPILKPWCDAILAAATAKENENG